MESLKQIFRKRGQLSFRSIDDLIEFVDRKTDFAHDLLVRPEQAEDESEDMDDLIRATLGRSHFDQFKSELDQAVEEGEFGLLVFVRSVLVAIHEEYEASLGAVMAERLGSDDS